MAVDRVFRRLFGNVIPALDTWQGLLTGLLRFKQDKSLSWMLRDHYNIQFLLFYVQILPILALP